LGLNLITI